MIEVEEFEIRAFVGFVNSGGVLEDFIKVSLCLLVS